MFQSRLSSSLLAERQHRVARETGLAYAAQPDAAGALAKVRAGIAELRALQMSDCSDAELEELLLVTGEAQSLLAAQEARVLEAFEHRRAYREYACITTGGFLRLKTNLGPGAIKRRVKRARVMARMPALREAFETGAARVEHIDAVAYRVRAARLDAVAEHDATLATLATNAEPRDVVVAVQRIIDAIDADGSEDAPDCKTEDLRDVSLRDGFFGLGDVVATTTPLVTELLRRVRDVYDTADPADTPEPQRRSYGQRFHDALRDALTVALDHHPGATVGGIKTHVVLFADLFTLLGNDELARIQPRLSSGGFIDPEVARHLIATTNPTLRAVLGLGPWMPVTVGRAQRTLPGWLRAASQLSHRHCRGPGCDLPFASCEGDHVQRWADGGPTSLTNDIPLCPGHNDLKEQDGWTVHFDPQTGHVTWTSTNRETVIDLPPPDI